MSKALRNVQNKVTAQTEQADSRQVKNNAGGFTFEVSPMDRLERFLILGSDGGTYYVGEKDLTKQNVDFIRDLLKTSSQEVIARTVDVSVNARAKNNSQALFVLALAMNTDGVDRSMVKDAVQKVARTSTHLYEYAQYLDNLGGWGRAKTESIAEWYRSKTDSQLAYQMVKYRQRNGWSHRDLLRLSHVKGLNSDLVNFALGKEHNVNEDIIIGFELAQQAKNVNEVVRLIEDYGLMWEAIPTEFHKDLALWRGLFDADQLGQTALLRNVTRIAKLGGFDDMRFASKYAERLADKERIIKGKVHPINYLLSSVTYEEGQVIGKDLYYRERSKSWNSASAISEALDDGFYSAFGVIEPAMKRHMLALDISGSMGSPAMGIDLNCSQVSAAMAMFIARTEPYAEIRGFSSGVTSSWRSKAVLKDLGINRKTSLNQAMRKVNGPFGSTDCAQPMLYALENGIEIDTFVIITDNETYYGDIHPHQALTRYRKEMGIDARLAVFGTASTSFTIADPSDKGQMDFVGFDSAAPAVLANFSAGRI